MISLKLSLLGRGVVRRTFPPYVRLEQRLAAQAARTAELAAECSRLSDEVKQASEREAALLRHNDAAKASAHLAQTAMAEAEIRRELAEVACRHAQEREAAAERRHTEERAALATDIDAERRSAGPRIQIERGAQRGAIDAIWFDGFPLQEGDRLSVIPAMIAAECPVTWGDTNVSVTPGVAIRVPQTWRMAEFRGLQLPAHLVDLTGAGPETLDTIGKQHLIHYATHVGLRPDMTVIDLGCGIGRDAFQFIELLDERGRYIGIDVTRDSIVWGQRNITPLHPNFSFHHFDAFNELYNPHGAQTSMDMRLPAEDGTVDRIVLASVFTHLLEDEVVHYLQEFRRVLKPDGKVYANFFLYSAEAIAAAQSKGNTSWVATFAHHYGGGVYGNDPGYPRGAVAYSAETFHRLIGQAGLQLVRPFLKGWWSGLHEDPDDGQDAAILQIDGIKAVDSGFSPEQIRAII